MIRRVGVLLLSVLVVLTCHFTGRADAQEGDDDRPPRRHYPHTCSVGIDAYGYRGWVTNDIKATSDAYVIRLEALEGESVEYEDYFQLNGTDRMGQVTFKDVPVPTQGILHYRLTVTYLVRCSRRRVDPDHDHDDDSDEVRHYELEFDKHKQIRVVPQDAGQWIRRDMYINVFDVPTF